MRFSELLENAQDDDDFPARGPAKDQSRAERLVRTAGHTFDNNLKTYGDLFRSRILKARGYFKPTEYHNTDWWSTGTGIEDTEENQHHIRRAKRDEKQHSLIWKRIYNSEFADDMNPDESERLIDIILDRVQGIRDEACSLADEYTKDWSVALGRFKDSGYFISEIVLYVHVEPKDRDKWVLVYSADEHIFYVMKEDQDASVVKQMKGYNAELNKLNAVLKKVNNI